MLSKVCVVLSVMLLSAVYVVIVVVVVIVVIIAIAINIVIVMVVVVMMKPSAAAISVNEVCKGYRRDDRIDRRINVLVNNVVFWVFLQQAFLTVLAGQHIVVEPWVVELGPVQWVAQECALLPLGAEREVKVVEMDLVECVVFAVAVLPVEARVHTRLLVHFLSHVWARKEVVAQIEVLVVVYWCAEVLAYERCWYRRESRLIEVLIALSVVVVVSISAFRAVFAQRQIVELIGVRKVCSVHRVCQVRAEHSFRARRAFEVHM